MQISVMINNFGQPLETALDMAQSLQIPAVQLTVAATDDEAARRRMADAVQARGMKVSAISVDVGDFGETEAAAARVEAAKPFLDVAAEIGSGICQTHVGIMPHTASGPRWDSFVWCCEALASYGETAGACLALETGPEPAWVMEKLMRTVDSPGLRVNYDPANLIIWPAALPQYPDLAEHTGVAAKPYNRESAVREFEPIEGVRRLGPYTVHTHAKDAVGNGGWGDVPLGEGWVDWPLYLRLLRESGFDGYLTIEREAGNDRLGEIGRAAEFLREQLRLLDAS